MEPSWVESSRVELGRTKELLFRNKRALRGPASSAVVRRPLPFHFVILDTLVSVSIFSLSLSLSLCVFIQSTWKVETSLPEPTCLESLLACVIDWIIVYVVISHRLGSAQSPTLLIFSLPFIRNVAETFLSERNAKDLAHIIKMSQKALIEMRLS